MQTVPDLSTPEDDRKRLPEESLFTAVIVQAIFDTTLNPSAFNTPVIEAARRWLEERPSSFRMVCDLAGLSPGAVQKAYERASCGEPVGYDPHGRRRFTVSGMKAKRRYRRKPHCKTRVE